MMAVNNANAANSISRPGGNGTGMPELDQLALRVLDASLHEAQRSARVLGPTIEAETWCPLRAGFPPRLIIYRGCPQARVNGDAWTTSKVEALRYCLRGGDVYPDSQVVVTAEIDVRDILSVYPHGNDAINLLVRRHPEIVRTEVVVLTYDSSGNRCAVLAARFPARTEAWCAVSASSSTSS